jgi:hypothetical protein
VFGGKTSTQLPTEGKPAGRILLRMKSPSVWVAFGVGGVASAYVPALRAKTQSGVFHMMLGDLEIIALNDDLVAYSSTEVLPMATPQQV